MSESLKNLSELSDAKLAELVKSGNDSAFDVLTLRYLRNIGFLAKKYSADGYERNDFVQEGLLGLLYACRTFDSNNKASFKSYVDIVAERRFISIVRKAQRQKAVPSSSLVSLDADNDELEGESTDPEQMMLAKENRKSLVYGELRVLALLRNRAFSEEYYALVSDIWKQEDCRLKIDYAIMEDLDAFKQFVREPVQIDHLIKIHQYTCDVWKNGSKYLYFYTLHNQ